MTHRLTALYLTAKNGLEDRMDVLQGSRRDTGLTAAEYAMMLAGVVVLCVLLVAAVTALINRKIPIINGG